MAHKKAGGSTSWGRESQSKRLGIKLFEGAFAKKGSILVRQRGTRYRPGDNVLRGGDDTLYSRIDGFVHFTRRHVTKFDGSMKQTPFIHVFKEKKVEQKIAQTA